MSVAAPRVAQSLGEACGLLMIPVDHTNNHAHVLTMRRAAAWMQTTTFRL
jgi:hypothetical protein